MVRLGIEQRDAAIRAGATGACTLVYHNKKLVMPMEHGTWTSAPNAPLFDDLRKLFTPRDDDVIEIVSAPNTALAEHCTIAAALTLLD